MGHLLGIDLGSSSVKVALVDASDGRCVATASYPDNEAPIKTLQPGWAEQRPDDWWTYIKHALAKLSTSNLPLSTIQAIGISYQMHGLVCIDKDLHPLRDAIIWCDSRGVPYGKRAFDDLGHDYCLSHLLNSPGNFTAAKLAWVKDNEPDLFAKIHYVMLPGDYLALRLTGIPSTTACGLSEMMLWDYPAERGAWSVMDYFGFPRDILPPLVPTFGAQATVSAEAAAELGLPAGIPVSYRAGDQPNNALSLGVLHPGEVAATAGTSGVVYGIKQSNPQTINHSNKQTLINTFLHVNHHLGVMHCVNGCGILNAWMKRTLEGAQTWNYDEMNRLAAGIPVGSEGVSIIPFGNGAERVLENRDPGCSIHGINFNRHGRAHLFRAAQEGIVFALYYGMEVMSSVVGSQWSVIRAGRANMFLSPLFREALATISGATIELYDTDGAIGAARAAAGLSLITDHSTLISQTEPSAHLAGQYQEAYDRWKSHLI